VNKFFKLGLALATFCSFFEAAAAAPAVATETRPLDARVTRVHVDGVVDVVLRQGSPAGLVVRGDPRLLEKTTTVQEGDTLRIGTELRTVRLSERFMTREMSGLRVEVTLPHLRALSSETVGATHLAGFSGDELDLTLEGAGSMHVNCNYKRLSASLGGVGSMNISGLNSDAVELDLHGAGSVVLNGRTRLLKADLGGLGGLNAQQFAAENVNLDLSGLGSAVVTAHQGVVMNLSGMGSVTVYGKPLNRQVSNDGLGRVSYK
jgi:hypothetical protein